MVPTRLESPRLILRPPARTDLVPYTAMVADWEVMRHMGAGPLYRLKRVAAESLARVSRLEARLDIWRLGRHWRRRGCGEWIVEERATGEFVGRIGFKYHGDFRADPCKVEIGWLLARRFWGRGYATEGASLALAEGFERLGLERVVSISTPANRASLAVMRRIGMTEAGRTHWHGLDVMWAAIDRSEWESAASRRSAAAW